MNNMFAIKLLVFLCFMLFLMSLSVFIGAFLWSKLKREKKIIMNGLILDYVDVRKQSNYLDAYDVSAAQLFSRNMVLCEREPEVKNLESMPSGMVSKLFINGRGSWRLTQGNIMTKEYLVDAMRREYRQKL